MTGHRPRIGRDHCDALAEICRRGWLAARSDHARDLAETIAERIADVLATALGPSFDAGRYWDRATPWELERRKSRDLPDQ